MRAATTIQEKLNRRGESKNQPWDWKRDSRPCKRKIETMTPCNAQPQILFLLLLYMCKKGEAEKKMRVMRQALTAALEVCSDGVV